MDFGSPHLCSKINTASSGALVDFSTQHHKRLFRDVAEIRRNDLDRAFLNMLERKEISSHTRRGQVAEFGEYPG